MWSSRMISVMSGGSIAAASVIAATPIAVLFLFFQKQITGGLTAGSIKG